MQRKPNDPPILHDLHTIRLVRGSRLHSIYGVDSIEAGHYCNYGVNPEYVIRFKTAGLVIAGIGGDDEIRSVEIPKHRFYVATLFHPQLDSQPGRPSKLVMALVNAARGRSASV